jgi:hypothetical protein
LGKLRRFVIRLRLRFGFRFRLGFNHRFRRRGRRRFFRRRRFFDRRRRGFPAGPVIHNFNGNVGLCRGKAYGACQAA